MAKARKTSQHATDRVIRRRSVETLVARNRVARTAVVVEDAWAKAQEMSRRGN